MENQYHAKMTELRHQVFELANEMALDDLGHVATTLHHASNTITRAINSLESGSVDLQCLIEDGLRGLGGIIALEHSQEHDHVQNHRQSD